MHSLDKEKIIAGLNLQNVDINIVQKISSTNDFFSKPLEKVVPSICIAEEQSKGRGRLNRKWDSPACKNIYMSLLYKFSNNVELSSISLVTGLAVRSAVEKVSGIELNVKWPNDILYENKKLCGILIEGQIFGEISHVTAGIGVNVNFVDSDAIDQPWTSLQKITGVLHDRNRIIAEIINNVLACYEKFEKSGFKQFMNDWNANDILLNKVIIIKQDSTIFEGTCLGVDDQGNIILKFSDGSVQSFNYGETSILSINFSK